MSKQDSDMLRVTRSVLAKAENYVECLHSLAMSDEGRKHLWDNLSALRRALAEPGDAASTFQERVAPWLKECFGPEIAGDRDERNHRFLEESLELVQSLGCSAGEAHQLVDYVFARPVGEPGQEVGGVMVTLAALCLAAGRDIHRDGEKELARIWTKVVDIRAKQAAKPKHSPLPEIGLPRPAKAVDQPTGRVSTRPRCARCQRYITIDTDADDALWAEIVGPRHGPGYICADCFTRAADERLIDWTDRVRLVPLSQARHRALPAAPDQPSHLGLKDVLARLEAANDALAAKRSNATYDTMMLVDRCQDELVELDAARIEARNALSMFADQADANPGDPS